MDYLFYLYFLDIYCLPNVFIELNRGNHVSRRKRFLNHIDLILYEAFLCEHWAKIENVGLCEMCKSMYGDFEFRALFVMIFVRFFMIKGFRSDGGVHAASD